MAVSTPSNATPAMIKWARETAGFSIDEISSLEKVEVEKIASWESGESSPTYAMLRKLSTRYKRPLMVFYLESPPLAFNVVKDFRLLSNDATDKFSTKLCFAIRSAQERQRWASTYLEEKGYEKCALIRKATQDDDPEKVGKVLREALGVTLAMQTSTPYGDASFGLWKNHCENLGIFIFQASGIEVNEMRGCALTDDYAPVCIVNSADSSSAKIFTLVHETAHLMLGLSGVSAQPTRKTPLRFEQRRIIEDFCNNVAAAVLMPSEDFRSRVPSNWLDDDDRVISEIAKHYRLSRASVLLRLEETGFATKKYVENKWPAIISKAKTKKSESVPIPRFRIAISRSGRAFSTLAVSAYHSGDIHGGELAGLLNLKLKHLGKLESAIYARSDAE